MSAIDRGPVRTIDLGVGAINALRYGQKTVLRELLAVTPPDLCLRDPEWAQVTYGASYLNVREPTAIVGYSQGVGRPHRDLPTGQVVVYRADGELPVIDESRPRWKAPARMAPRDVRFVLLETSAQVERLGPMDAAEVAREGIYAWSKDGKLKKYAPPDWEGDGPAWAWTDCPTDPMEAFRRAWDEAHGKTHPFAGEPFVVRREFVVRVKGLPSRVTARSHLPTPPCCEGPRVALATEARP